MPAHDVVAEDLRMVVAQVLASDDQETAGSGCGIADDILRSRLHQFDHQLDDMARGAELAVLAGAGDLAQHVLVDIALGVAIGHRHLVELLHDLCEQRRRWNAEASFLHVRAGGALGADHLADEWEDVLIDDVEHRAGFEALEVLPAQVLVGRPARIVAFREDAPADRLASRGSFGLLKRLQLVQALDEQQIGNLLHHVQRIRHPARPEVVPDRVDLVSNFANEHQTLSLTRPLALAKASSNASRLATTTGVSAG